MNLQTNHTLANRDTARAVYESLVIWIMCVVHCLAALVAVTDDKLEDVPEMYREENHNTYLRLRLDNNVWLKGVGNRSGLDHSITRTDATDLL